MNTNEVFLRQIKAGKRFIPVDIEILNGCIKWLDFEQYHFYEGFFHKSRKIFSALKGGKLVYVVTNFDVLLDDDIDEGCLYPSGFIFHASRSGSTLLSKVLARSAENHVISEPEPLNSIWSYFAQLGKTNTLTDNDKKKMYKSLVLTMGRPGTRAHRRYLVKFTSFNILFFEFIHAVFPDVPAIFISRDVDEILKSFEKKQPGWLGTHSPVLPGIAETADARTIVESFFAEARKYPPETLLPVDYKDLTPELLPTILKHFKANINDDQLRLMQKQFAFDAKVEFNQKKFNPF
jgi:hypothetical protein